MIKQTLMDGDTTIMIMEFEGEIDEKIEASIRLKDRRLNLAEFFPVCDCVVLMETDDIKLIMEEA